MHDPFVKMDDQNLLRFNQQSHFTRDLDEALHNAEYVFMCTAHKIYTDGFEQIVSNKKIRGLMDACNIYSAKSFEEHRIKYTGIGRGRKQPEDEFINFVYDSFRAMEKGLANELAGLIDFYNSNFAFDEYNKVKFSEVQKLARTCSTGCEIAEPGKIDKVPDYKGFSSRLVRCAVGR